MFWKESGAGDIPKPSRLQEGRSVSTLTLGNTTPTAKHFENTDTTCDITLHDDIVKLQYCTYMRRPSD